MPALGFCPHSAFCRCLPTIFVCTAFASSLTDGSRVPALRRRVPGRRSSSLEHRDSTEDNSSDDDSGSVGILELSPHAALHPEDRRPRDAAKRRSLFAMAGSYGIYNTWHGAGRPPWHLDTRIECLHDLPPIQTAAEDRGHTDDEGTGSQYLCRYNSELCLLMEWWWPVSTVPADDLTPLGSKLSAATVMTSWWPCTIGCQNIYKHSKDTSIGIFTQCLYTLCGCFSQPAAVDVLSTRRDSPQLQVQHVSSVLTCQTCAHWTVYALPQPLLSKQTCHVFWRGLRSTHSCLVEILSSYCCRSDGAHVILHGLV